MAMLKKIVNILVMIYLVVAVLIYLDVLNIGQDSNPGFYTNFFIAGGILMLLELLVENLYILSIRRGVAHHQNKINELKATLYDHKQELQDLKTRHSEEITAIRSGQAQHPVPNQYPKKPVMVPPPGHTQPEPGPGTSPANPNLVKTPAPLPPRPVDPENYPIKNSDSETYREPNH